MWIKKKVFVYEPGYSNKCRYYSQRFYRKTTDNKDMKLEFMFVNNFLTTSCISKMSQNQEMFKCKLYAIHNKHFITENHSKGLAVEDYQYSISVCPFA